MYQQGPVVSGRLTSSLMALGISYNDIIEMASVFENMKYLKYCNLYMLPWIYKKVNEFHNYDVNTFVLYCVVYSITTLSSSLYLFIKYKTIAIIFPLFITYVFFSAPFLLQEINGGRFVLDGCISFFNSINTCHLPIAISLIISYILSIIKCIDSICLHLHYFSYYFLEKNPWVYKNLNNKICSKFNGNKNICNISRNICSYNIADGKCEINTMKKAHNDTTISTSLYKKAGLPRYPYDVPDYAYPYDVPDYAYPYDVPDYA